MNKNVVITILLIIVLCLGGYLVFDKFIDKNYTNLENKIPNNENSSSDNNLEQPINFIGSKDTEVSYAPTYQSDYNLNYKINESRKLVFTDNNNGKSFTYDTIIGNCKYVAMAIPYGKQQPYYKILVITDEGNVYYKEFYAYAHNDNDKNTDQYSSMNDNFMKVNYSDTFIGIDIKKPSKDSFEDIIVYDKNSKPYYLVNNSFNSVELIDIIE